MMRFLVSLVLMLAIALAASTAHAEKRVALVIGNSKYEKSTHLSNPRNDAQAMRDALKQRGFEVTTFFDLRRKDMVEALHEFGQKSAGADVALVFFAGHGMEHNSQNYLMPVDFNARHEDYIDSEAVKLDVVVKTMLEARIKLVFLDSCRNNPLAQTIKFTHASRSGDRGFSRVKETEDDTLIFFATKHGKVAADGTGDHSPFTKAILDTIHVQGLEIDKFFRVVHDKVLHASLKQPNTAPQQPWVYGARSAKADFYFHPEPPEVCPANREPELWNEAVKAGSMAAFRGYLQQCRNGAHFDEALIRITKLQSAGQTVRDVGEKPPVHPVIAGLRQAEVHDTLDAACRRFATQLGAAKAHAGNDEDLRRLRSCDRILSALNQRERRYAALGNASSAPERARAYRALTIDDRLEVPARLTGHLRTAERESDERLRSLGAALKGGQRDTIADAYLKLTAIERIDRSSTDARIRDLVNKGRAAHEERERRLNDERARRQSVIIALEQRQAGPAAEACGVWRTAHAAAFLTSSTERFAGLARSCRTAETAFAADRKLKAVAGSHVARSRLIASLSPKVVSWLSAEGKAAVEASRRDIVLRWGLLRRLANHDIAGTIDTLKAKPLGQRAQICAMLSLPVPAANKATVEKAGPVCAAIRDFILDGFELDINRETGVSDIKLPAVERLWQRLDGLIADVKAKPDLAKLRILKAVPAEIMNAQQAGRITSLLSRSNLAPVVLVPPFKLHLSETSQFFERNGIPFSLSHFDDIIVTIGKGSSPEWVKILSITRSNGNQVSPFLVGQELLRTNLGEEAWSGWEKPSTARERAAMFSRLGLSPPHDLGNGQVLQPAAPLEPNLKKVDPQSVERETPPPSPDPEPAEVVEPPFDPVALDDLSESQLRSLQAFLKRKSFYTFSIDGKIGPGTRRAMTQWFSSRGKTFAGTLDKADFFEAGVPIVR